MFDKLVNIIPLTGDMIIIKDGHFIMAVFVMDGEVEHVCYNEEAYCKMTGFTFSVFATLDCIGSDGETFFYWMDA